MSKYPQGIRELGYQHRRKAGIKYVELPQLQDNLRNARKVWLEFKRFWNSFIDNVSIETRYNMDALHGRLDIELRSAWLAYFGCDAEAELQVMHNMDVFDLEKEMQVLIIIDYDNQDIETYRGVKVYHKKTDTFETGDPAVDYAEAMRFARSLEADEIVQHSSCTTFVLDSKGKYTYNLRRELVRVERE